MSALDAIGGPALAHPITGEVIEFDDTETIKGALRETEDYLRRPEVRRMWDARDALQARLAELEPMALPRAANQTDKQRRVERCPRCRTVLPSEPVTPDGGSGDEGDGAAGPVLPGSEQSDQTTLLPRGPRTPEQEAALGVDIFGERDQPEPLSPPESQAQDEGGATGGAPPSPLSDPIIQQAGEVEIKSQDGSVIGTVASMVADDPARCRVYLQNGKDERLKAALVTYMAATRPELLEET